MCGVVGRSVAHKILVTSPEAKYLCYLFGAFLGFGLGLGLGLVNIKKDVFPNFRGGEECLLTIGKLRE